METLEEWYESRELQKEHPSFGKYVRELYSYFWE